MSDNNGSKEDKKEQLVSHKKLLETSSELRSALNSWDELCKQSLKPAADEQMLMEIKGLLSKLKNQIEDFK
jgi:hypothetical protein